MIGFAFLGCGRIGKMQARNIAVHPRAELAACYDAADAAKDTAGKPGAEAAQARSRSSWPTAESGPCEKPMDLDMARVGACWCEIAPLRPLVAIGFNRRFDLSLRSWRDRLLSGKIGTLVYINNSRRCAYGYDQRVKAFKGKGMLQAGNRRAATVEAWDAGRTRAQNPVLDFFVRRYRQAYEVELDQFIECVEHGAAPLAGFAEGRDTQRLADAALESLKTGRALRVMSAGDVAVQEAAA